MREEDDDTPSPGLARGCALVVALYTLLGVVWGLWRLGVFTLTR